MDKAVLLLHDQIWYDVAYSAAIVTTLRKHIGKTISHPGSEDFSVFIDCLLAWSILQNVYELISKACEKFFGQILSPIF